MTPVNVSWSGVPSPSPTDMIALYVPAATRANMSLIVPVEVRPCQASPNYLNTGSGSAVFYLANFRADVAFTLFQNCTGSSPCSNPISIDGYEAISFDYGSYVLEMDAVAQSAVIVNTHRDRPSSGSLSIASSSSNVIVQWTSASSKAQGVQWGLVPIVAQMVRYSRSNPDTYTADQMCGSIAQGVGFLAPGFIHTATISLANLKPNTRVFYRYGSDSAGWSSIDSFFVAPAPGDFSVPLRIIGAVDVGVFSPGEVLWVNYYSSTSNALSYSQYGANASKLVPWLEKERAHVLLLPGDISYAQGLAADWDIFGNEFETSFRRTPLAVGMGNHERNTGPGVLCCNSTTSRGECGIPTLYRYSTPATSLLKAEMKSKGNNGAKLGPLVYSFSRGPVHFVMLDTEMDSSPGSPQHLFVEQDLSTVDRSVTPWVIMSLHRPMYLPTTYWKDINNAERLLSDWEVLFLKYKVDVVFSGHEHSYSRTCPIFNGTCCSKGRSCPVYIVAGTAGAGFTEDFPSQVPSFFISAFQYKNGYVRWTAKPKVLKFEMVSTDSGSALDSTTLLKAYL